MTSGKDQNKQLIINRVYLFNNIENIVKESVYYRTNSSSFSEDDKICLGNIDQPSLKKKIL
jgi:hypothetical protein